jgi:hypothetical protein
MASPNQTFLRISDVQSNLQTANQLYGVSAAAAS